MINSQKIAFALILFIVSYGIKAQIAAPPPPALSDFCDDDSLSRNEFLTVIDWDGQGAPPISNSNYYAGTTVVFTDGFYFSANQTALVTLHGYLGECPTEFNVNNTGLRPSNNTNRANQVITIHPNPTHGLFHITNSDMMTGELVISDIQGRIFHSQKLINQNEVRVDMTEKANGVYIITIITNDQRIIKKFIKN